MRTNRPLSQYVPATKSASWTECASSFDDNAVISPNNQDFSGNEHVLSSSLEIDELCNQVIVIIVFQVICPRGAGAKSVAHYFPVMLDVCFYNIVILLVLECL